MKKHVQILWLIVAVILFVLPFPLYNALSDYIDTANHENRELAEKPELDISTLAEYPEAYDEWMNDNLPFRNQLVTLNSLISIYLFGESPSDEVIIGEDGWLFYNHGSTVADFQGTNLYSEAELEQLRAKMIATQEALAEQGMEFVLFIAPNKEQVYADKMPDAYGTLAEYTFAQQIYDSLKDDITVVYAAEDLIQARQAYPQYDFYCHLDTHWNRLGAYVGTKALLRELGIDLPEIEQLTLTQTTASGLDLSALMNMTALLNEDINYNVSGYSDNVVELVEDDSTFPIDHYRTSGADSRKVLVIRDSFSLAMVPYLTSQFNDVIYIYRDYYNVSLLEEVQPDIVIFETIERYLYSLISYKIAE